MGHLLSEGELQKYGSAIGGVLDLWNDMYRRGDADKDHPFYEDVDFYTAMQESHDDLMGYSGPEFVSFFRHDMKSFAQHYGLEVTDETAVA